MGMTFIMNLYSCGKIVIQKKRNPRQLGELSFLLQNLAFIEMIEVMVSLSFMLSLLVAYFGPNSNLIGNVGSSLCHYRKIEDIRHTVTNMFALFLTDFSSIIVTGVLLKLFCNINLINVLIVMESEFGIVFCIILCFLGTGVSTKFHTNTGI